MHLFLNFNILGTGLCSLLTPLLFEVKFLFKNLNNLEFYSANQCLPSYQEGTKVNIEVNVRVLKNLVTFILEYKAPLISIIGTNFLQPSALDSHYAGGNAAIPSVCLLNALSSKTLGLWLHAQPPKGLQDGEKADRPCHH